MQYYTRNARKEFNFCSLTFDLIIFYFHRHFVVEISWNKEATRSDIVTWEKEGN